MVYLRLCLIAALAFPAVVCWAPIEAPAAPAAPTAEAQPLKARTGVGNAPAEISDPKTGVDTVWAICDGQRGDVKRLHERLEACNEVIARGPTGSRNMTVYLGAFRARALVNMERENYGQALKDIDELLRFANETHLMDVLVWQFYWFRAEILMKLSEWDKASGDLDKAFDSHPMHEFMRKDEFARELRGDIAVAKGDYGKAMHYYQEEFKRHPDTKGLPEKLVATRFLLPNGNESTAAPVPRNERCDDIRTRVTKVIAEHLGTGPRKVAETAVTDSARFKEDLKADDLDMVELVMAVETEFGIEIPDAAADKMRTVGEFVGYLQSTCRTPAAN